MMKPVLRIQPGDADPTVGEVAFDSGKILWTGGMIALSFFFIPFFTNWQAIVLAGVLTYVTLLLGHSVGMHRMMIHKSFKAVPWLRYLLLYIGTLVGIGGPSKVIQIHDTRDWAQRAPDCHDFFSHDRGFFRDLSWQLFYKFKFENPPELKIEAEISADPILKHFDKYWRWHQLGLAGLLFLMGGWPFVVWGICVRVTVSTLGHWTITYFCHNPGPGRWDVSSAGVQASNLKMNAVMGGFLTHGECWHNNHHAFPESARIGLESGEFDPAWIIILALSKLGLIYDISHPRHNIEDLTPRAPLPN